MPDLPNLANLDYVDRINRAIDHVTQNLASPLPLEDVARAACFSPYHFHRIFRALMGETLGAFIKRVRLERSVYLLSHVAGATLTEIAFACGFSSSSDFSRAFRAHYGVPPRQFDVERIPPCAPARDAGCAHHVRRTVSGSRAYLRERIPTTSLSPCVISRRAAWRISACIARTRETMSREPWSV